MSSPHLFAFLCAGLSAVCVLAVVVVLVALARDRRIERRKGPPVRGPEWLDYYRDDVEGRARACRDAGLTD